MTDNEIKAIERGVRRGLQRCGVYDDDIEWMTASISAAVIDEFKDQGSEDK